MGKTIKIRIEDKQPWEVGRGHYNFNGRKGQFENKKKFRRNRKNAKRAWLDSKEAE